MMRKLLFFLLLCVSFSAKAAHPVGYGTVIGEWTGTGYGYAGAGEVFHALQQSDE